MIRKEEVYVRVSSKKKARKLKELLDMFGEKVYGATLERLKNGIVSDEYPIVHYNWEWNGIGSSPIDKTELSLKELRNILAKEHLKEGDIIVASIGSTKYVVNVEKVNSSNTIPIGGNKWICIDGDDYPHEIEEGEGGFNQFIRYATEEEKALLEPKKELDVGKWYRLQSNNLVFTTSELSRCHVSGYGFSHGGKLWSDEYPNFLVKEFTEATLQEVEKALIKEAKRRYGNNWKDVKIKAHVDGQDWNGLGLNKGGFCPNFYPNGSGKGYSRNGVIYYNGKWAEVIKHEKSLEERVNELEDRVSKLEE